MTSLAAIIYPVGFRIDAFMAALASGLKQHGLRLGGVVQHNDGACEGADRAMALEDLASGLRYPISQDLGVAAGACRLDPAGLAAAGGALSAALSGDVDLVIVNKFGRQEALGQGLRQEIAAALLAGLPLLVAVREDVMPAWRDFAGEDWAALPAQSAEVEAWALARAPAAA